jgi:hypothetical protein
MRFGGVVENYLECVKAVVIDDRNFTSLGRSLSRRRTNEVRTLLVDRQDKFRSLLYRSWWL